MLILLCVSTGECNEILQNLLNMNMCLHCLMRIKVPKIFGMTYIHSEAAEISDRSY